MTVLCLVELDGTEPADASLRALALARTLGDTSVRTVLFADAANVAAAALAGYGVTDVYVIEPATLDGYAPAAWPGSPRKPARPPCWRPEPTAATRCWRTSARSPACRWPRTAPWSPPTAGARTGSSGTGGPGCCSRTRSWRRRSRCSPWPPTPWLRCPPAFPRLC